jgi:hypothetical protein
MRARQAILLDKRQCLYRDQLEKAIDNSESYNVFRVFFNVF